MDFNDPGCRTFEPERVWFCDSYSYSDPDPNDCAGHGYA